MSPTGYKIEINTVIADPSKVNIAGFRKNAVNTLVRPIAMITVSRSSRAPVFIFEVNARMTPKKISG